MPASHVTQTNQTSTAPDLARIAAALLLCAAIASAAGCYRRVTGARGIGADRYQVSEPYQEDTRADRWFYGDDNKRSGSRLPN